MDSAIDRIDIHRVSGRLATELQRIPNDPAFLPEQRRVLLRYIADARTGRLPGKRLGRRLADGRCLKLIVTLRRFALYIKVPFDDVTVEQMQGFILGLETGTVTKLIALGDSDRYSPDTIVDFKKIIRRFYRWLWGECFRYQDLTYWFDIREQTPELKTFGQEAAQRLARRLGTPQSQALVMALFDGGFRAGEFFNVRLSDLRFAPDADGTETCFVRIRVSKTKPRTISLPLATDAVRFWVERHPQGGPIKTDGTIDAKDPRAQIITWTYAYCRKLLHGAGKSELGERLYFHRFRHSSATFYARFLTEYQMCARYGWAIGSRSVRRYIEVSAVLAEDTASVVRRSLAAPDVARSPTVPTITSQARAPPAHPQEVEPYEETR